MIKRRASSSTRTISFDDVVELTRDLPRVERGTAYGSPALKVDGKMFVCIPTHRSAEPNSLAVRVDFADRDDLIENEPDVFYLKDHYADYAVVLIRLARIHRDALRDLLHMSWRFMSAKNTRVQRRRRPLARRTSS
jgi:hypothetical protein